MAELTYGAALSAAASRAAFTFGATAEKAAATTCSSIGVTAPSARCRRSPDASLAADPSLLAYGFAFCALALASSDT